MSSNVSEQILHESHIRAVAYLNVEGAESSSSTGSGMSALLNFIPFLAQMAASVANFTDDRDGDRVKREYEIQKRR